MKKFVVFLCVVFLLLLHPSHAFAADDPVSVPNNKFGVHILFPYELKNAAQLVNSGGGDWGYVTMPIQAGDKNIKKWQDFMDQAKNLHIIPIIRLATEGDYFNTTVWRKPTFEDVLDFANFLNSLNWPTKNRYVVVFNEPNNGDEWGGTPNPDEYAQILSYAVTAFKAKSADFFILSAGLDNAAPNSPTSMNEYAFLRQMDQAVAGVFNQIDGFASHSYPNPAFSQPPTTYSSEGVDSFKFETSLVDSYASKKLPVFITETGWSRDSLSDKTISSYLQTAFSSIWNDDRVVAVTPFLLEAGAGPFEKFSLLTGDGKDTPEALEIMQLPKTKGQPEMASPSGVLAAETPGKSLPILSFTMPTHPDETRTLSIGKEIAKLLLRL